MLNFFIFSIQFFWHKKYFSKLPSVFEIFVFTFIIHICKICILQWFNAIINVSPLNFNNSVNLVSLRNLNFEIYRCKNHKISISIRGKNITKSLLIQKLILSSIENLTLSIHQIQKYVSILNCFKSEKKKVKN